MHYEFKVEIQEHDYESIQRVRISIGARVYYSGNNILTQEEEFFEPTKEKVIIKPTKPGPLPERLYRAIEQTMPITSVEAVVIDDSDRILVLKRKNAPAKGKWWFPGGRVHRGETVRNALIRELKEETGLAFKRFEFVGVYERFFPERHDISLAYVCSFPGGEIKLNEEHSARRFLSFDEAITQLDPFLVKVVKHAFLRRTIPR